MCLPQNTQAQILLWGNLVTCLQLCYQLKSINSPPYKKFSVLFYAITEDDDFSYTEINFPSFLNLIESLTGEFKYTP